VPHPELPDNRHQLVESIEALDRQLASVTSPHIWTGATHFWALMA